MKKITGFMGALLLFLLIAGCSETEVLDNESVKEEIKPEAQGTVEEYGMIKYRSAEWDDDFGGLKTNINSVTVDYENSAVYLWVTLENTSDDKFLTYPDQAKLVLDNGMQYSIDMIESDNIGGEIVGRAKKDGELIYYVDYDNIKELKSIRLIWDATNTTSFEKKDYDVKIDLLPRLK